MEDDAILMYIAGGVILFIAGAIIYQMLTKNGESVSQSQGIPVQPATISHKEYYNDLPQFSEVSQNQTLTLTPIVQNEELIKWTDWLGRERVITISRKVH